jgi:hypothetical protein
VWLVVNSSFLCVYPDFLQCGFLTFAEFYAIVNRICSEIREQARMKNGQLAAEDSRLGAGLSGAKIRGFIA